MSLLAVLAIPLALYGAALGFLWFKQEALLFHPVPLPADYRLATEPDVHEATVEVDGARISVLQLRLPRPRGVVFFLHGNAGNLAGWFTNTALYRQANFDLVMLDYRGYGKSSGRVASPGQLRGDVRAVWDHFAPYYQDRKRVVFGRSLGTALAADLAEQLTAAGRPPDLTVLVSPYASMRELTSEIYPWVPGGLLRYPLDTGKHLPQVRGPILLLHGSRDELIPPAHGVRLQQRVPEARLVLVEGAGHNDIHDAPAYRQALLEALARL